MPLLDTGYVSLRVPCACAHAAIWPVNGQAVTTTNAMRNAWNDPAFAAGVLDEHPHATGGALVCLGTSFEPPHGRAGLRLPYGRSVSGASIWHRRQAETASHLTPRGGVPPKPSSSTSRLRAASGLVLVFFWRMFVGRPVDCQAAGLHESYTCTKPALMKPLIDVVFSRCNENQRGGSLHRTAHQEALVHHLHLEVFGVPWEPGVRWWAPLLNEPRPKNTLTDPGAALIFLRTPSGMQWMHWKEHGERHLQWLADHIAMQASARCGAARRVGGGGSWCSLGAGDCEELKSTVGPAVAAHRDAEQKQRA